MRPALAFLVTIGLLPTCVRGEGIVRYRLTLGDDAAAVLEIDLSEHAAQAVSWPASVRLDRVERQEGAHWRDVVPLPVGRDRRQVSIGGATTLRVHLGSQCTGDGTSLVWLGSRTSLLCGALAFGVLDPLPSRAELFVDEHGDRRTVRVNGSDEPKAVWDPAAARPTILRGPWEAKPLDAEPRGPSLLIPHTGTQVTASTRPFDGSGVPELARRLQAAWPTLEPFVDRETLAGGHLVLLPDLPDPLEVPPGFLPAAAIRELGPLVDALLRLLGPGPLANTTATPAERRGLASWITLAATTHRALPPENLYQHALRDCFGPRRFRPHTIEAEDIVLAAACLDERLASQEHRGLLTCLDARRGSDVLTLGGETLLAMLREFARDTPPLASLGGIATTASIGDASRFEETTPIPPSGAHAIALLERARSAFGMPHRDDLTVDLDVRLDGRRRPVACYTLATSAVEPARVHPVFEGGTWSVTVVDGATRAEQRVAWRCEGSILSLRLRYEGLRTENDRAGPPSPRQPLGVVAPGGSWQLHVDGLEAWLAPEHAVREVLHWHRKGDEAGPGRIALVDDASRDTHLGFHHIVDGRHQKTRLEHEDFTGSLAPIEWAIHERLLQRILARVRWPLEPVAGALPWFGRDDLHGRGGLDPTHRALDIGARFRTRTEPYEVHHARLDHPLFPLVEGARPVFGPDGWPALLVVEREGDYELTLIFELGHVRPSDDFVAAAQRGDARYESATPLGWLIPYDPTRETNFRTTDPAWRARGIGKGDHVHLTIAGLYGRPSPWVEGLRERFVNLALVPALEASYPR